MLLDELEALVRAHRFRYVSELALQDGLYRLLAGRGYVVERERRLDARSRLDLFVETLEERVAIETKVAGSTEALERQVKRYLESGYLRGVLVVTSRVRHLRVRDPRVRVVALAEAGL